MRWEIAVAVVGDGGPPGGCHVAGAPAAGGREAVERNRRAFSFAPSLVPVGRPWEENWPCVGVRETSLPPMTVIS